MNLDHLVCSCTNGGLPWLLDGVPVISHDPACRVHNNYVVIPPQVANGNKELRDWRDLGDWKRRERVK